MKLVHEKTSYLVASFESRHIDSINLINSTKVLICVHLLLLFNDASLQGWQGRD